MKEAEKTVKVGSKVKVELLHTQGIRERFSFEMSDGSKPRKIGTTSITSPLGSCIKGQKVGFEGDYMVLEKKIHVTVLEVE